MYDGETSPHCDEWSHCTYEISPGARHGFCREPGEECGNDAVPHTDRCVEHHGHILLESYFEDRAEDPGDHDPIDENCTCIKEYA